MVIFIFCIIWIVVSIVVYLVSWWDVTGYDYAGFPVRYKFTETGDMCQGCCESVFDLRDFLKDIVFWAFIAAGVTVVSFKIKK